MSLDPDFLSEDEVVELHSQALDAHGGLAGVRDPRSLESAVAQPSAMFDGDYLHGTVFLMAAAYAFHLSQSQAFVDGNKRTGLLAALAFLARNGCLVRDPDGELYDAMMSVAVGDLDKDGLAEVLERLSA